jgi:hypothetical protein
VGLDKRSLEEDDDITAPWPRRRGGLVSDEADPPRLRGACPVVAVDGDENGPGPRVRIPALAMFGRPVGAQAEGLGVEDEDLRPAPGRELVVDLGPEQIEVAGGEIALPVSRAASRSHPRRTSGPRAGPSGSIAGPRFRGRRAGAAGRSCPPHGGSRRASAAPGSERAARRRPSSPRRAGDPACSGGAAARACAPSSHRWGGSASAAAGRACSSIRAGPTGSACPGGPRGTPSGGRASPVTGGRGVGRPRPFGASWAGGCRPFVSARAARPRGFTNRPCRTGRPRPLDR